ncbi:MAG: Rrf2 family transcriptional regulator [Ruminiclostridium sp.]|nr:Rrf2 family transcriptional regulator [Ruminiclostridium sp.]
MKLSTRGRYGLKAMLDLAIHNSEGQVVLKNIAERQGISENYLEQLFAVLKKAKLVKSLRGSQGGYTLGCSADQISVGDILRALEGSFAPVECVAEDHPAFCSRFDYCVTKGIWEKIRDSINAVIDSTSLESLVEEYRKCRKGDDYIYHI